MTDTLAPPDVPDTALNAADAAAKLVAMSAAFKASQSAPGPWGLSAEEANAQLQAMADSYRKSTAPKLTAADQTILGESADVPREFETTTWPAVSTRNKLSAIEELRQVGIPDPGIARVISGESYSRADFDAAVRWRDRVTNDPVLSKELLDGSSASRHVITAMSAIIALGPPAEAK
jgi:hypothetical protein